MTTEQKFNAAVNVIRSLPKNGSYQPSNDLMLRFYGFFKQATEGTCIGARPAFWDIVGRAKYDAWKKLGNMPKTEAMAKYVDELHSIVETMSYSDNVANFLEAPTNELESIPINDLELIAGDIIKKVRSRTGTPLVSEEDESDEEYIDTIDAPDVRYQPNSNGLIRDSSRTRTLKNHQQIDITSEITRVVQNLQANFDNLRQRVQVIEKSTNENYFSPALVTFMVVWPFICTFLMNRLLKK